MTAATMPIPTIAFTRGGARAGRRCFVVARGTATAVIAVGMSLIGVGAFGAPALTGANNVGSSASGEGGGTVSGFSVSDVDYSLGDDPGTVSAVRFSLSPAPPVTAEIRAVLGGSTYLCTSSGAEATCDLGANPPAISDVTELRVIAAE